MLENKVLLWIKEKEQSGYTPEQLYTYLTNQGYSGKDAQESILYVNENPDFNQNNNSNYNSSKNEKNINQINPKINKILKIILILTIISILIGSFFLYSNFYSEKPIENQKNIEFDDYSNIKKENKNEIIENKNEIIKTNSSNIDK